MDKTAPTSGEAIEDSFRKAIHDLNGELFLIRGHVELARAQCPQGPTRVQLDKIYDHTEVLAEISKRLKALQTSAESGT